ncbi:MAG: hypothetical protein RIS70_1738 [Planctomycetota bacterium]
MAFSVECMFACTDNSLLTRLDDGKFPYELHSEEQVRLGRYPTAIRYRDHLVPSTHINPTHSRSPSNPVKDRRLFESREASEFLQW